MGCFFYSFMFHVAFGVDILCVFEYITSQVWALISSTIQNINWKNTNGFYAIYHILRSFITNGSKLLGMDYSVRAYMVWWVFIVRIQQFKAVVCLSDPSPPILLSLSTPLELGRLFWYFMVSSDEAGPSLLFVTSMQLVFIHFNLLPWHVYIAL